MESNRSNHCRPSFHPTIIGSNFALFTIARGCTKGGDLRWMSAIRNSLSKPMEGSAKQIHG